MTQARALVLLTRHIYHLWRAGQLRFRLETFGVYYPALPYTAPWWKTTPRNLLLLLRQVGPYAAWLVEMEDLHRQGPRGWWRQENLAARAAGGRRSRQ